MNNSSSPRVENITSTSILMADIYIRQHEEMFVPVIVNCALNAALSITTILGNTVVIYSLWNCPLFRSPAGVILFLLALCDLGVGVFVQPLFIIYHTFYLTKRWQTWVLSMRVFNIIANFFSGTSFLTVAAVSVDRFLSIHLHVRYQELVTVRRTIQLLIVLCLFTATFSLTLLWNSNITFFAALTVIVFCYVVITSTYLKMYLVARSHRRNINGQLQRDENADEHSERTKQTPQSIKSVTSMFYVCFLHVFCFLPYLIFLILRDGYRTNIYTVLGTQFAETFVYLNSTLNPFVYCWRLRDVRNAVKRTLTHFFSKVSEQGTGSPS